MFLETLMSSSNPIFFFKSICAAFTTITAKTTIYATAENTTLKKLKKKKIQTCSFQMPYFQFSIYPDVLTSSIKGVQFVLY